jgi:carbamoyltransferase
LSVPWGHDNSVVVFEDRQPIFAVEQERVVRTKHGEYKFPDEAVQIALDECNLTLEDIDRVVVPYEPRYEFRRFVSRVHGLLGSGEEFARIAADLKHAVVHALKFRYRLRDEVREAVSEIGDSSPPMETRSHHYCHAASAYYPSGFDTAVVLTVDGMGEYDSTVVWHAADGNLNRHRTYAYPNSLGLFYALITSFLGFRMFDGEGKVMALAAYGNCDPSLDDRLREFVQSGVDYDVTRIVEGSPNGIETQLSRLEDQLGRSRRKPDDELNDWHQNLAFSTQKILEESLIGIVKRYCTKFDTSSVAIAGGAALNCKANKQIMELSTVDSLFIQPVANDAGVALGAGLSESRWDSEMDSVYMGQSYGTDQVRNVLERSDVTSPGTEDTPTVTYSEPANLEATVADRLANGAVVGWFQGAMEFGPRALGHRSILADPRNVKTKERINSKIKGREQWRPFAPSLLESAADEFLIDPRPAPFMIRSFDVKPAAVDRIPAVIHPADNTTRPQTVTQARNPSFFALLSAFESVTGTPVLLNTSFNISGDPIVDTPEQAISVFSSTDMDLLVIGSVLVEPIQE